MSMSGSNVANVTAEDIELNQLLGTVYKCFSPNKNNMLTQESFIQGYLVITSCLYRDFDRKQAINSAIGDWKRDVKKGEFMRFTQFRNFLLDVAQMWVKEPSEANYVRFFAMVLDKFGYFDKKMEAVNIKASREFEIEEKEIESAAGGSREDENKEEDFEVKQVLNEATAIQQEWTDTQALNKAAVIQQESPNNSIVLPTPSHLTKSDTNSKSRTAMERSPTFSSTNPINKPHNPNTPYNPNTSTSVVREFLKTGGPRTAMNLNVAAISMYSPWKPTWYDAMHAAII